MFRRIQRNEFKALCFQVSRWSIRTRSQTESSNQAFIHPLQQCKQEAKKKSRLPSAPFFPTEWYQARADGCSTDGKDALNKRLLRLYGHVSQRDGVGGARATKVLSQSGQKCLGMEVPV